MKTIATFALAALCASTLWAQPAAPAAAPPAFPKGMPGFGADPVLPAPQITRSRLPNGLEVWVVPRTGLPRVDAVLAVRGAGSAADGPGQAGFSALLAELLSEGTTQRDARTLAQDVQALGGSLSASASADGITLGAQALASQAGPLLQLLAEVARQPAFADAEVRLAQGNALQGLSRRRDGQGAVRRTRLRPRPAHRGRHRSGHAGCLAAGACATVSPRARVTGDRRAPDGGAGPGAGARGFR